MGLCHVLRGFPGGWLPPCLASAQLALLASQGFLRGTIEARVLTRCPSLSVRKDLRPTSIPMSGCSHALGACSVCGSVSHTMRAYQCPSARKTRWTVFGIPSIGQMQLDLEGFPDLLGHDEVFLLLVQIRHLCHTAAVGWNAIGCLS